MFKNLRYDFSRPDSLDNDLLVYARVSTGSPSVAPVDLAAELSGKSTHREDESDLGELGRLELEASHLEPRLRTLARRPERGHHQEQQATRAAVRAGLDGYTNGEKERRRRCQRGPARNGTPSWRQGSPAHICVRWLQH